MQPCVWSWPRWVRPVCPQPDFSPPNPATEQGIEKLNPSKNEWSSLLATAKQLVEIRARRGPYTDPRRGRVLRQICYAFNALDVDILSTTVLLEWCYGARVIRKLAGDPSWLREQVKQSALKICIPLGRSSKGSGRPMMWKLDPEKAA